MKDLLRILFSITVLLTQAHAEAQPRCETIFTPDRFETKFASSVPETRQIIQVLGQQKALILGLKESVDPSVADNYIQYLDAYSRYLATPTDGAPRISQSSLVQKEARLRKELELMQQAADEIRAIRYPRDEINEKVSERHAFIQRIQEIESLWLRHKHTSDKLNISEQTLKRSRNDGKGSANALRAIKLLSREANEIEQSLHSNLESLSLSEYEKADLRSFFGAKPLDAVISSIFSNGSSVHLPGAVRTELATVSTRDSAVAVYLQYLKERHTSRLDREIEVTLESYSAVAYKYYERLFPWGRNNRFQRHSDILDLALRARLIKLESELEKKQTNFENDLRLLESLWLRRSNLLNETRSLEKLLAGSAGDTEVSIDAGKGVIQLGEKFRELQTVESRISSFFPLWKTHDRFSMFVGDKLTKETLATSLKNEIESIKASLVEAGRDRESWLVRHKATDNVQDDIELF